jgi:hypothetical protein
LTTRKEVTGGRGASGLRKLHNEELQNLYSRQSIIREVRSRKWVGGKYSTQEEKINAYKIFVRRHEEKRLSGIFILKDKFVPVL